MDTSNVRTVTATELAEQTGDVVNRVYYSKQPALITRRGKPIAVIVDVETWQSIEEREGSDE